MTEREDGLLPADASATLRHFLWWTTLSSIGGGLVLPLTALFLAQHTSLGISGTAVYFAVVAVVELASSSVLVVLRRSAAPGLLAGLGYLLVGGGYALLAVGPGLGAAVVIATVVGIGRGASAGGVSAYLRLVFTPEQFRDIFARRYRAMNVGLGVGLLTATVLLSTVDTAVIPVLFVVNGLSFVPLAAFLLRRRTGPAIAAPTVVSVMTLRRLLQVAGPICLVDLCVFAFAYSQFDSALPLASVRLQHASAGFVAAVVAVNTVAVVLLQNRVSGVLERRAPGRGMQVAMALWCGSFVVAALTAWAPGLISWGGLLLLAVLFACGECAYASSFQAWLLASVPDTEATRASSLSNVCSSVGLSVGPSLAAALIGTGHAALVWGALASGCLFTLLLVGVVAGSTRAPQPTQALR